MSEPVRVRVDPTPNPNSVKLTVNRILWEGRPLTVEEKLQAFAFPLAGALLDIPGVRRLFFLRDFVTITRRGEADWQAITDAATALLLKHVAEAEQ